MIIRKDKDAYHINNMMFVIKGGDKLISII